MSDIVVKGRTFYKVDPTLAKILESLFPEDVQRRAAPLPIQKRQPTWLVTVNQVRDLPQIELKLATGETITYPGPGRENPYGDVEEARAAFKKTGFPLPSDVAEKFEAAVRAAIARNQAKRNAFETGYRG